MEQDIKVEIGKKIRNARVNRGLTQSDICDDESDLTIRQLARIENGQAMATIPKLMYLSQKLGMSIQDLVDIEKVELPKHYLEIKNKLIKSHTYGDKERLREHEAMFEEIYDAFYEFLPEEEQLLVEILQVKLDVFVSFNTDFALGLFEEYFHQILRKKRCTYNDLLFIDLYIFCCAVGLEDNSYVEELSQKVLVDIDYSDPEKVYLLERIVLTILTYIEPDKYLFYTRIFREIIEETQNFQHKSAVYVFEAKYYLQIEKNRQKTVELYNKSIMFAEMLNDKVLVENLKKEMECDLAT